MFNTQEKSSVFSSHECNSHANKSRFADRQRKDY